MQEKAASKEAAKAAKVQEKAASTEAKEAAKAAKVQEKKVGKKGVSKKAKAVAVPIVTIAVPEVPAVLEAELEFEDEEIQVDEVEWRGRSYLVADDGTLFDDAHAAVGHWNDHATAGSAPVWTE